MISLLSARILRDGLIASAAVTYGHRYCAGGRRTSQGGLPPSFEHYVSPNRGIAYGIWQYRRQDRPTALAKATA